MIESWGNRNCNDGNSCQGNDSETKVAQLMSSYCWTNQKGIFNTTCTWRYYIKFAPSHCSNYILSRNLFVIAATANALHFESGSKKFQCGRECGRGRGTIGWPRLSAGIMLLRRFWQSVRLHVKKCVRASHTCLQLKCHGNQKPKVTKRCSIADHSGPMDHGNRCERWWQRYPLIWR